jgi:predicted nucleic acid-binding protein
MNVDNFLDSNVLVYLFDGTDQGKQICAEELVMISLERGSGCISFQVVQETINVITRKLGASADDAGKLLDRVLAPLWKVNPTRELHRSALGIQTQFQFSFYDSLIVAAALNAGCKTLYSEDLQHGQRIEKLTITNPFIDQLL